MQGSRWVGRLRRKGPRWVDEASSGFHSFPPEGLHHQPHLGGLGLEVGQGGSKAAKKGRGREGHPISGGPAMCQAPTRAEHAYMPEAV